MTKAPIGQDMSATTPISTPNSAKAPAGGPALSVAMSVYNGERFLAEAIESILAQTFTEFEFLILDDGSSDETPAIIAHYAARDLRIRPIIRENRGLVASLNELLAQARAPIVARMDADDISLPDRFAVQMAFLEANPDHGVVGAWSRDIDELDQPFPTSGRDHPVTHADFLVAIENDEPLLCHPVVMYRRDIVLSVGGYHAAFRHVEDYDLWLRLVGITRMSNIPQRLICYRHYDGQVSNRHATEQQVGHSVAWQAWQERKAGRPDPTEHIDRLPPIGELDVLFGRAGVDRAVRARLALALQYSPTALRDAGFDYILQHLADGGDRHGLWRTTARLMRFGEPARAVQLAAALVVSNFSAAA